MKIIKSLMMISALFCGIQLFSESFTTKLFIGIDQKDKEPSYTNVNLDSTDTGSQAKEKIHEQTKIPITNKILVYEIKRSNDVILQGYWPDDKTWDSLRDAYFNEVLTFEDVVYLISKDAAIDKGYISDKNRIPIDSSKAAIGTEKSAVTKEKTSE